MSKRVYIIIFIFFCLAILIVSFFYFYLKNFKVPQELNVYLPRETVFYAEFNLRDKNLANFYQNNFRGRVRFEALINESGFFGSLSPYLIEETEQVAFLVVNYENNWQPVWLVSANNIHRLNGLLPVNYYSSILNTKTLALSKNRGVLKLIKEVEPVIEHSAGQRKVLNQFSQDNFINIYLAPEYLKFLSSRPDPVYLLVLNNLNLNFNQPAFLGLSIEKNKIVFDFRAVSLEQSHFKNFSESLALARIKDDKLFFSLFLPHLKDVFNQLDKALISEKWAIQYEFKWSEVEELLNHPGIIFAQIKNGPKIETSKLLTLDQYNYGLMIKTDWTEKEMATKIEQIKKVVRNILAFKHPSEKVKILLDGSRSIELVAEPAKFEFSNSSNKNNKNIKNYRLELVQTNDFAFTLGYKDNYLMLGNNEELVEEVLDNEVGNEKDRIEELIDLDGHEMVVINSRQLARGLLSYVDKVVINVIQKDSNVELKGYFLNGS